MLEHLYVMIQCKQMIEQTLQKKVIYKMIQRNALYLRLPIETTSPEQVEEATPPSPTAAAAGTSTTPGKTKRKVLKKKQYTNERGFMGKSGRDIKNGITYIYLHDLVTEDVWEWEEVDAPEAAEAATKTTMNSPKRTPEEPKKKSFGGKKKSGGAQQDLFSFWKKR